MSRFYKMLLSFTCIVLVTACDTPEEKHAKYMARGDRFFEAHDYTHARLEYKNAAQINPTDPRVIYSLGLVEEAQGNLQAALSAFLTAEQQDMNFEPVVQKLAEFFLTAQQDSEAKIRVHRLLSINPENAMGHALKASLLLKDKAYESAKKEATRALELDPKNIVGYSVLSGLYHNLGQLEKAHFELNKGIEQNPEDVSLYLLKAVLYAEEKNTPQILDVYRKIFEMVPKQIHFRFDLAEILSTTGETKTAQDILRETVKQFPDRPDAKRKLLELLEKNVGISAAETEIKTYLQSDPDEKTFYLWLADLYMRNKRDDLAISALKKVLETAEDDWVGHSANTSMARIELNQGDIIRAQGLIDAVLSKDVNNMDALFLRANLAFLQGDVEQAIADLRNILRDNPAGVNAAKLMTEILVLQGHKELAIDTLIRYHDKAPDDLGAQVRLAQLQALQGNSHLAFDILEKITQNDPTFAVAWETMARLAIENKRETQAQEAIQRLEKIDGQAATTLFLKGQLVKAQNRFSDAQSIFKQVIQRYPETPLVEHAIAALLDVPDKEKNLEALMDWIENAQETNPTLLTVLGGLQLSHGREEESLKSFEKAIALHPKNQTPFLSLAEIFKARGEIEAAISVLEQADTVPTIEPRAALRRADFLVESGKIDEGINLYESLLEKHSGSLSDVIANNLAQTLADYKGNHPPSLERARIIAERFMNANNPFFLDTLAWVYYKKKDVASAEPLIKKAKSLLKTPNEQIESHYQIIMGQKKE